LALHSAAVLADELLETKPVNRCLACYEERLRPFIERKQFVGELLTRWLVPVSGGRSASGTRLCAWQSDRA